MVVVVLYQGSGNPPLNPKGPLNGPCEADFRELLVKNGSPHGPNLKHISRRQTNLKFAAWFEVNLTFCSREISTLISGRHICPSHLPRLIRVRVKVSLYIPGGGGG